MIWLISANIWLNYVTFSDYDIWYGKAILWTEYLKNRLSYDQNLRHTIRVYDVDDLIIFS